MRSYLDSDGVDALWAKIKAYVADHGSGSSEGSGAVIGAIQMYGGATAPAGWLLCDGSAVSRTTYSKLFEVLGTAYGEGDGSTTFNVPNFSGRFPIGHCNSEPTTNTSSSGYQGGSSPYPRSSSTKGWFGLGEMGGEDSHVLTTAEMPSHNHSTANSTYGSFMTTMSSGSGISRANIKSGTSTTVSNVVTNPNSMQRHEATGSVGGGGGHNQIPPYLGVNYIVYAG